MEIRGDEYAPVMEERRREMEKGQQVLVSSAAGTKAGRQEKGRPAQITENS